MAARPTANGSANALPLAGPPACARAAARFEVETLLGLPFNDLLFRAQIVRRRYFDANRVQMSTLLSIKTGGCPEDCAYCPQSARYDTGVEAEKLMAVDAAVARAKRAKAEGACCSA